MAYRSENEPLYRIWRDFASRCLLDDKSLLWPDHTVWTAANVAEVKKRMVDSPLFGEGTFEDKLVKQMQGATAEAWRLIADVYYLYYLPSTSIKLETKQNQIRWALQQGQVAEPLIDWQPQQHGFTRTSQKYHYRYAQFWLILLMAQRIKSSPEAAAILNESSRFQRLLDDVLVGIPKNVDRANDLRHGLLYIAFPECYERSISSRDKERIVETFKYLLPGPVPQDVDQAIRQIRESLAKDYDRGGQPFDFYSNDDLRSKWRMEAVTTPPKEHGQPPEEVPPKPTGDSDLAANVDPVRAALALTRNVILYGPPGTGKTYVARQTARKLVEPQLQRELTEASRHQRAIEGLAFHEVVALSIYAVGAQKAYSVPDLQTQPLIQTRFHLSSVARPSNYLWSSMQAHTSPDSKTVGVTHRLEPFLFDKDEKSRWFLTPAGREYVQANLADALAVLHPGGPKTSADEFIVWTTFHQSYAYEEFVEGIRPRENENGEIGYPVVPGVFRRICDRAAADKSNKYVLVIDEINRGNIAKIFGELITLIEDDKRGDLVVTLPYSGQPFSVPENLYLIGTMNTADRSIALLDIALRRRFAFVEILPDPTVLAGVTVELGENIVELDKLLNVLNRKIGQLLGPDQQIGHSYFLRVKTADSPEQYLAMLGFIWNHQIIPLLQEYFYSQPEKLGELLEPFGKTASLDGVRGVPSAYGRLYGEDLLEALSELADSG